MKKIILWLSVSVALLAAAMFVVVKKMPYFSPSGKSTGDLVYAGADELTGITVRFGKEKIKLRKLDGSWLVNGYYGRNAAADEYANRLQRATILSFSDAAQPKPAVKVRLDGGARRRFSFSVLPTEDPGRSVIGIDGKNYLVSENLMPPAAIADYYLQPLLPFAEHKIEQVIGLPRAAAEELSSLPCLGASRRLPEAALDPEHKSFAAVTADGIKVIFGVYKYKENYRLTVSLKTTIMPTEKAAEFVKQNGFRYDGWYFVLSRRDGSRLFEALKND